MRVFDLYKSRNYRLRKEAIPRGQYLYWLTMFSFIAILFSLPACHQDGKQALSFVSIGNQAYETHTEMYDVQLQPSSFKVITEGTYWEVHLNEEQKVNPEEKQNGLWYEEIVPNTDLVFYDKGNAKAGYDFIIKPGGAVEDIKCQLQTNSVAGAPFIDQEGALLLPLEEGYLKHSPPVAYQEIDGEKQFVESRFQLEDGLLAFEVGKYDATLPLVIDPEISFVETAISEMRMVCMLDITSVSVGECRNDASTGNMPQVLVSVLLDWTDPPAGDIIEVTLGAQTQIINPADDGCPGYVQFLVTADGSTGDVMAVFSTDAGCNDSEMYTLPSACMQSPACTGGTTLGGNVYSDFDASGTRGASEFGKEGIIVKVFDCDNNEICNTTTDLNGNWTCEGLTNGEQVRVEFSNFGVDFYEGGIGTDSKGGSVQVATVGECDVDFGVSNASDFCDNAPLLVVPCYVNGDVTQAGGAADADVLVGVPYNASGGGGQGGNQNIYLAVGSEIGTTWGVAYQKETKQLFTAAFLKRHTGLTSHGLGAIFTTDLSTMPPTVPGASSLFVNLDDLGIVTGDETMLTRDLVTDPAEPSYDSDVFDRVGKWGLGDLDISDDGTMLYVVNLFTKSIIEMPINNPAMTPGSANEIPIPDPGCSNTDDWRPFGLKYHNGRIYVGGVCSAQTSQSTDDLQATIYEYDPVGGTFDLLLSFALDYPKGAVLNGLAHCTTWNPWTDDFNNFPAGGIELCYPQPMLADIEFDVYGNMMVAFIDRAGHQMGWYNYGTNPPDMMTWKGNAGGDILRIYNNNGAWLIEQNGTAGYDTGCGAGNGQGPCSGEFYCQDAFGGHQEAVHGGIAIHPSFNQLALDVMDPIGAFSAGIAWYNNSTGVKSREYEVYYSDNNGNTGLQGKAAGLGDLEMLCGEPILEIGNLVWLDDDFDGVQDGCEPPISGMNVTLYEKNTGNEIASTQTDGNGFWVFGTNDGLLPNKDYIVAFGVGQSNNGPITINGEVYVSTGKDIGMDTDGDVNTTEDRDKNDSDVMLGDNSLPAVVQGIPVICLTTGNLGENNHCYDAGFISGQDFGDLPDSYSTLAASNGASHALKEGLFLGSCVDFEGNGAPDAQAGTDGSGGDDQTAGTFEEGMCNGNDDEDGVTLLTQLIPGSTACIEVTASSTNGTAVLNAWIDFNGDGDFAGDPNENLVFTSIDGSGITPTTDAPVANGVGTYIYCFDVPAGASFPTQELFMRVRLSMNGGLPYDGPADSGEVEDYYEPLSKIGNVVWEDINGNALQDAGEPGVMGAVVTITGTDLQGNNVQESVTTGPDGMYMFPGLLPGQEYCINFDISNAPNAADLIFTPQDVPYNMDEVNDSDANPQTGDAGCYTLAPLEYNEDVDAGVYYDADGDFIPDSPDGNTELDPQGFIYCEDSGEIIPGGLVQVTAGPGVVNLIQDGSNGEYQFFVSQPGTYTIAFTPPSGYVVSTACLDQGLLDPDPMDPNPFLVGADDANNDGFLDDASCGANPFYLQFTLEVGEFILQNNIPLSCAEIGDLVWEDNDTDGVQDPSEPGVSDITVLLFECAGGVKGNQIGTTTTDANGNYEFTGLPGNVEYCVQFDLVNSTNPNADLYFVTTQDQTNNGGNDTNDSDANLTDGCTTSQNVAPGEEYDDFDAGLYLLDLGDLPENTGYPTVLNNMGPAHAVPSAGAILKLGATVDVETDGQPDPNALGDGLDEDGVNLPMFMTGIPVDIDVSVMNMTSSEAKLTMFVDWNNDGDFNDVNEMYSVMVPDGATVVTLDDVTPPLTANLAVPIGIRFRISTDQNIVMSPTGLAPDGEVEDYLAPSMGFDFGDLNDVATGTTGDPGQPLTPADYQTSASDNGPSHKIITDPNDNPILKIGAAVDDEADGQPSADAGITGGDDNAIAPLTNDPNDEDGIDLNTIPLFIITQTTTLDIPVMNMTGTNATMAIFIDFNKDGFFDPSTERFETLVLDQATMVSVNIPVPLNSVIGQDVGLRIRLANDPADVATAVGPALSGEVEDYMVQIVGFDYGDLPDTYGTNDPDGPKHIVSDRLKLGACVDVELNGQPEPMAGLMTNGDDNQVGLVTFGNCGVAGADEDGIEFISPMIPGNEACIEVSAMNMTGIDAFLQMWVDYNGDGVFGTGEEVSFTSANGNSIPDGGLTDALYCFDVPAGATFQGGAAFVRFRLSETGNQQPDSQPLNNLTFGEVEDYKVPLYKVGSYVWDDLNGDGLQDDFPSPCMDDLDMNLQWAGPDGDFNTTADNQTYTVTTAEVNNINGQYIFCGLIPGTYELSVDIPNGLQPTTIGVGNDPNFDSNDPNGTSFTIPVNASLPTGEDGVGDMPGGINGFPDTQDNFSFDFGLVTDGYTITCNCDGSITIDWDPFSTGDNWTVVLEDENGLPALNFVNMPEHIVTIAPGSLNNGECYALAITENIGINEVTSIQGFVHANCYPVPEISMTGVGPTCPDSQDGEVTITITEQGCTATYDVYLTSQNSGEQLVGNDVMITAPIVVTGLGEDTYGVRMELVDRGTCAYGDGCFPLIEDDLLFLQNTDTEAPTKLVFDASGAEITDMVIDIAALPQAECGIQLNWTALILDNCQSAGVDLTATITTSSANPSVVPAAQVTVLDNEPTYAIEIFAAVGVNTLTLTATDFNGNENVMVYTINVPDNHEPVLYCPSDMNVEIPSCEEDVPVNWTVSVVDDCDLQPSLVQTAGPASGDVLTPGMYTVSYEATDDYGNVGTCSFNINVTQAPSPEPIVDVSGNGSFNIEHCEEDGLVVFSGNIYDCNLNAANFNLADLTVNTIPLSAGAAGNLSISYTLPQDGYVYFEATGNLSAGSYLIVTNYQGVSVDHGVIVTQDPDEPAVMDMPGNLSYTIPECSGEAPVSFAVQLTDDCDDDLSSASFTVNGAPAPPYDPALSDPVNGLYVWNLSLPVGMYTIQGTYTDGHGNITTEEATISINSNGQDDWAPIIIYPSQNIDVALEPCGPSTAVVVFEVTATDNCDAVVMPTVTATCGTLISQSSAGGDTYVWTGGVGSCTINISAMDNAGNTRTEDFQIVVTQDAPPLAALVCNDDVNVTLNDNCQREITADMLLEGEFGCFDNDDFTITIVNDDNPANGNLLDGCGEFIYEVELNAIPAVDGFTGDYADGNWFKVEENGSTVNISSSTATLVSSDAGGCNNAEGSMSIAVPNDGTITFDYDYVTSDPVFELHMIRVTSAGVQTDIVDINSSGAGSVNLPVTSGDMLYIAVISVDCILGPGTATITNFHFEPVDALPGPIDWEPCWGYISGEDKDDPIIECPPNTGTGTIIKNGYTISGTIDDQDPQVVVNDWSCLIDNTQPNFAGTRYVDVQQFQVDSDDIYTFLVQSDITQTGNVAFAIYQDGYDPSNPCENIIAQADIPQPPGVGNPLPGSQGNDPYIRMSLPLRAGAVYYLATTTFTPDATGNYQYSICSDDDGRVGLFDTTYVTNPDWSVDEIVTFTPYPTAPVTIEVRLHCEDFDLIFNNPASLPITGSPIVSDNCDANPDVTFVDTYTQNGDCGDIVIKRTFTATDEKGNSSSCMQFITLTKVLATTGADSEVWLPPFTVPIECDEDLPNAAKWPPNSRSCRFPICIHSKRHLRLK